MRKLGKLNSEEGITLGRDCERLETFVEIGARNQKRSGVTFILPERFRSLSSVKVLELSLSLLSRR